MKLNQPFSRRNTEVVFNTPEPVKAEVPATPEVLNVPPLTKIEKGIPSLQPVQRQKTKVELSPPQSVAESEATAEPENSGGGRDVVRDADNSENIEISGASEAIPKLVPVDKNLSSIRPEIPKLQTVRKGEAIPTSEIPQLTSYNKMEVVHLLLGRSVEDEEVVLLQSFSERFVQSKNPEEFSRSLKDRVLKHAQSMNESGSYDFPERWRNRLIRPIDVAPIQKQKGVEWAAGFLDDGRITNEELHIYCEEQDISQNVGLKELQDAGYEKEAHFVYTWALVKVRIGHDFGSFKLSELMPTL